MRKLWGGEGLHRNELLYETGIWGGVNGVVRCPFHELLCETFLFSIDKLVDNMQPLADWMLFLLTGIKCQVVFVFFWAIFLIIDWKSKQNYRLTQLESVIPSQ